VKTAFIFNPSMGFQNILEKRFGFSFWKLEEHRQDLLRTDESLSDPDLAGIVREHIAAVNNDDIEKNLTFFTDGAIFEIGAGTRLSGKDQLYEAYGETNTKAFRYVPSTLSFDPETHAVFPFEMMEELIQKVKVIALVHCPCRATAHLIGKKRCDHPLENCIKYDELAEYLIENRIGREMTYAIGITCSREVGEGWGKYDTGHFKDYVFEEYSRSVETAGGTPILIPVVENRSTLKRSLMGWRLRPARRATRSSR
jgi:hypothetical protein